MRSVIRKGKRRMYTHMAIHHPVPGKEANIIASMHRYSAALQGAPGLVSIQTLYDEAQNVIIGLAVWETEAAFFAAVHLGRAAVENDPFDEWEAEDIQGYRLVEV
jgi:heme-degrading monooxygenase HmoA